MPIETWEYVTEFVCASIESKSSKEFLQERWPDWKNPPKFTPETMIPRLNGWGDQGWELVHMQPVALGKNSDVFFPGSYEVYSCWYFCVFKRRKS